MKKIPLLFALALICAAFSSCVTGMLISQAIQKTYKENFSELPKTESSTITFENTGDAIITINKWNDNDIKEALYGAKIIDSNDKTELTVPPGDNSFNFDVSFLLYSFFYGNSTYKAQNIELQYKLEAGKEYIVKPRVNTIRSENVTKYEFFIGIYSDVEGSEPLKEWKLGEA